MSMADHTHHKPQHAPPVEEAAGAAGAVPTETPPQEKQLTSDGAATAPTQTPPATTEGREGVAATWLNSKKITALWSINQTRNSWIYLTDTGWKRLADNSDSAVVALTMLASHAQHTGATVNALEDAGKITQLYVW
jgi:hypothetical protein